MVEIQRKIDLKTKPLGSLGQLEELAAQICSIQNTLSPALKNPHILVFAGDHGIAQSGVSAYPAEVTPQMVLNFLGGGAAINVFSRQHKIKFKIVDSGVNYDFQFHPDLINAKIAKGTKNFLFEEAMSHEQLLICFEKSAEIIQQISESGCNIIGFGEMGIGNTSSASLLMSSLTSISLENYIGKGTGLNDEQLHQKIEILKQAQQNHAKPESVNEALQFFGGFEIAQMCGAMLEAYRQNMIILVDGFIATAAYLCAFKIDEAIQKNAIFCHQSNEKGHIKMLDFLNAKPVLNLNLRLGEGTGCALAYPIIESAVNFMNEMASFESAGVSNKV